jgi:hypothetical protein
MNAPWPAEVPVLQAKPDFFRFARLAQKAPDAGR